MIPKLKAVYSPDIANLEMYCPDDPKVFGFLLQMNIGPNADEAGEETFDVMVCTPDWLKEQYHHDDIIVARHYLIVFEWNYQRLIHRIEKYLMQCAGDNWKESAQKIGRLGKWEFEDYKT